MSKYIENIKGYMKETNTSEAKLARGIGLSGAGVNKLLAGTTSPLLKTIESIADYFGVTISHLVEQTPKEINTAFYFWGYKISILTVEDRRMVLQLLERLGNNTDD